ncbi:MAG: type II secretion system protein GspG [Planctomycetes bacterium]|nr:type II secretion system protein GspG [Planctomycetota bacterium]
MILLCTLAITSTIFFDDKPIVTEPVQQWTRKVSGDNIVSLEIVSRRYEAQGRPDVWLIGVAHIADESFYGQVASLLEQLDVVLYESVRPSGSRPPMGDTPEEKINTTKKSLTFIADSASAAANEMEMLPMTMDDVITDSSILDRRLSGWLDDVSVDAWENPIVIVTDEESGTMTFTSYGADGKQGGEGESADIVESRTVAIASLEEEITEEDIENEPDEPSDNIQQTMADSLGLAFQLDELPYEEPNWFVSDLTIDEVESKLEEGGADTALLDTITGASFAAKIANSMMQVIPLLDALSGGGVSSTARLLMIEILSMADSEAMQVMQGIEPELLEVIIVDRNTEVLSDLAAVLDSAEDVSSVGILYGAGHMVDLSQRMEKLFGYVPVEDKWFSSMSVDPRESLLDESDMTRMRFMLKYQMYKAQEAEEKSTAK